jgi:hypothetical protein
MLGLDYAVALHHAGPSKAKRANSLSGDFDTSERHSHRTNTQVGTDTSIPTVPYPRPDTTQ